MMNQKNDLNTHTKEFFSLIERIVTKRINSSKNVYLPKKDFLKMLENNIVSLREDSSVDQFSKIFYTASNKSTAQDLLYSELLFFEKYLENVLNQKINYLNLIPNKIPWKSILKQLSIYIESLKEAAEQLPNVKALLSILKELIDISVEA